MSAFSSDEKDVVERQVVIHSRRKEQRDPENEEQKIFELDRCVEWIRSIEKDRIGLQFPDELLQHSAKVACELEGRLGRKVYVLGDTTYASCCVDEVAAEHVNIEAVIHFGHSCGSSNASLPVLRIFAEESFDVDNALERLRREVVPLLDAHMPGVVVTCDPKFSSALDKLAERLPEIGFAPKSIIVAKLTSCELSPGDDCSPCFQNRRKLGRMVKPLDPTVDVDIEDSLNSWNLIHVGDSSSQFLRNWILSSSLTRRSRDPLHESGDEDRCRLCLCFDPASGAISLMDFLRWNPFVKRRYFAIEKAKDALRIGLLVGTLGVRNYDKMLERSKQILALRRKKFYVFVVGKPNPAKLANFPEVDAFVLFGCPESSFVEDPKEYLQPILTPYEMELACEANNGKFRRSLADGMAIDFAELLPGGCRFLEVNEENFADRADDGEAIADVSLISNSVRISDAVCDASVDSVGRQGTLAEKSNNYVVGLPPLSVGHGVLVERSWVGVEFQASLPQASNLKPEDGLSGLAACYSGELSKERTGAVDSVASET